MSQPNESQSDLHADINALVDEETQLRNDPDKSDEKQQRLRDIERKLDQLWDLLRQRRAKEEFGENPADAQLRPESEVENYRN